MKAEVIDNTPHGYDVVIHYENESCIIHEGMYHKGYAKKYADDFNSALSSHVSKETAPLLAEIDRLKNEVERLTNIGHTPESEMNELSTRELIERLIASQLKVEKLEFMIEHGLGYEDMANDITMPHEV